MPSSRRSTRSPRTAASATARTPANQFPGRCQVGEVRRYRHHLAALVHTSQFGAQFGQFILDHAVHEQRRAEADQSPGYLAAELTAPAEYQRGPP